MYSAIWVNSLITSFQHRHSLLQEQVIPRLLPIHIMAPKHTNDPVSRQDRKAKKRKLEDAVPDLPGDNDNDNDNGGVALEAVKSESEERMSKKARKEEKKKAKKLGNETGAEAQSNREGEDVKVEAAKVEESETKVNLLGEVEAPRKSKKERKAERKAKDAAAKAMGASEDAESKPTTTTTTSIESIPQSTSTQSQTSKRDRDVNKPNNAYRDKKRAEKASKKASNPAYTDKFIIFVGNLPFTATTASIEKHFGTVKPKSIRHLTKKEDPSKSKGCAFVEFDDYTQMETALRLFHHSVFNDGLGPGRKINVELT